MVSSTKLFGNFSCTMKTITPVFIGNGRSYFANEFVTGKAKLKDKKVNIIKRIDVIEYYKDLTDDKKDKFIENLSNQNFKLEQYDSKVKNKYRRYNALCKFSLTDKNGYKNIPNEIAEGIKTNDKFFIPGSSLKGAIRTGLLYNLINVDDIPRNIIQNRNGKYRINRFEHDKFINNIFSAPKGNSAQKSIMRFLQISDSSVASLPHIYDLKTIKAKPSGVFEDHGRNGRVIKTYAETIGMQKSFKFSLNNSLNDDVLKRIGIEDKKYLISLKNIKESLYNFSNDIIDHEIEFYEEYNNPNLKRTYENLSKRNNLDNPLIKIGSGSGLLATSIGLKIKNDDSRRFEEIRQSFRRSYEYEFPKSRKITSTNLPLGWVQLSFADS